MTGCMRCGSIRLLRPVPWLYLSRREARRWRLEREGGGDLAVCEDCANEMCRGAR